MRSFVEGKKKKKSRIWKTKCMLCVSLLRIQALVTEEQQGHGPGVDHKSKGAASKESICCYVATRRRICMVQTRLCNLQRNPAPGQTSLGNGSACFHWSQMTFTPWQQCQSVVTCVILFAMLHFIVLCIGHTVYGCWTLWASKFCAVNRW